MNHPADLPPTGPAPAALRDRCAQRLAACPVVDHPVHEPDLWVAALVVDAIWFGTHTGAYPLDERAWARICAGTARLAGLASPVRSALSPALHTSSLRSPLRPILDASSRWPRTTGRTGSRSRPSPVPAR